MVKDNSTIRISAALKIEPRSIRSLKDLSIIFEIKSDILLQPKGREGLTLGARNVSSYFRLLFGLRFSDGTCNWIPGIS